MSHLKFSILASSTNFCPFRTDLSGNAIWPQASDFYNFTKLTILMNFCPIKMLNETFSVNFNHCDPRMEPSNKLRDILVNRQTKMQKAYRTLCTIKQSSFIISICSRRNQNVASCFYHHHRVLEAVNPGIEQRKFITWIQPRRTTVAHCSEASIFRPKIQLYWIWFFELISHCLQKPKISSIEYFTFGIFNQFLSY